MQTVSLIAGGKFRLVIRDPTVMGWVTTAAFILAAVLCAACARRAEHLVGPRIFWWSLAVALLLLGVNKQLDLQFWLTAVGRQLARTHGWYSRRRTVQIWFVAGVATAGLFLAMLAGWTMRRWWRETWLALLGLAILIAFVVIRAASIHHVDEMLRLELAGLRFTRILELGGIGCIGTAAALNMTDHRKRKTP